MPAETKHANQAKEPGFRNLWYVGIVSLFTDISSAMILGVLPLFVTIDLGATKELLGLMEGAADSLNYAFRSFAGVISGSLRPSPVTRPGRRYHRTCSGFPSHTCHRHQKSV